MKEEFIGKLNVVTALAFFTRLRLADRVMCFTYGLLNLTLVLSGSILVWSLQ